MDEVLHRALEKNFDIRLARIEQRINLLNIPASRSVYDTLLSSDVNYAYDNFNKSSRYSGDLNKIGNYGLGVSRLLPWGTTLSLEFGNQYSFSDSATANVDKAVTTSRRINLALAEQFSDIAENHFGYSLQSGGEWEETQESINSLFKAFCIAGFLVFMILAANFRSLVQPLIVMLAIPFGFIGVIIGFYVHDLPLGFMALLGVVGLSGVVVNDSIVLVEGLAPPCRRKNVIPRRPVRFLCGKRKIHRSSPSLPPF